MTLTPRILSLFNSSKGCKDAADPDAPDNIMTSAAKDDCIALLKDLDKRLPNVGWKALGFDSEAQVAHFRASLRVRTPTRVPLAYVLSYPLTTVLRPS